MIPMRGITFLQPRKVCFGRGALEDCGREIAAPGQRVHILTSNACDRYAHQLERGLQSRCIGCTIDTSVDREPTTKGFRAVLESARVAQPNCIVGIGGGSVLDTAKLVAAFLESTQPLEETFGIGLLKGRSTGLVCLPTTAGTGSEVSPNAILLDEVEQLKKGIVSPYLVPDAAYIDPLLMVTLPKQTTATTGIDAMTHCIEAYTNKFAHLAVDLYALEGVRLSALHLVRAVDAPSDLDAREGMALASLYGGLCLGPVNTAAVHALAYPLAGMFHMAHGLSIALLLPHVFAFNISAAPERHAAIALALGVPAAASETDTGLRGAARLYELAKQCGVEMSLSAHGISEASIGTMSAAAMKVERLLKNNPREVSIKDAERIYRRAFRGDAPTFDDWG